MAKIRNFDSSGAALPHFMFYVDSLSGQHVAPAGRKT